MKITRFKSIDSTNKYLQDLLEEGVDIIDNIVVAEFQSLGKGQGTNVWESEAGKNLLFSVALDMSFLRAENQFILTQMVSVAMIDVLKKYFPEEYLSIKWPNDIYFNNKKIAGILIKNEIKGMMLGTSIIGIGLNVNQECFDENLPNPISMKMITGEDYDLESILKDICFELKANTQQPTANSQRYTDKLYRYRQWSSYKHEGSVKEMMIIGYDQFGRLILKEKNDSEVVCDLKEVKFIV